MLTREEKITEKLKVLNDTPDFALQREKTGDDIIMSALKNSADNSIAKAEGAAGGESAGNTPQNAGPGQNATPGTAPNIAPVPAPAQTGNPAEKYAQAGQPQSKLVNFKLKELLDPELVIMIMDMFLSWGGALLLQANGMEVKSEDLQADDFQKMILIKGFTPAFETYEVGTNNPAVAMVVSMVAVYGKNIANAIRENKKQQALQQEGRAYEKQKHKRAKYPAKKEPVKRKPKAPANNVIPLNNFSNL